MADDRRIQRIQSRIRQDVAELFLAELKDPRMKGLISITRVKVSKDLTNARVFYSVLGSAADRRSVARFIESVTPMVQRHVVEGLKIRVAPKVSFTYDDGIEKQDSVSKLIDSALASDRRDSKPGQDDE
ncbi:MAG: 30S ribosome-binding factor RbfA [Planctomycetes bacterium]|nr:30S ribosome-binding factor RbfA [Planctomycetota bacterium]